MLIDAFPLFLVKWYDESTDTRSPLLAQFTAGQLLELTTPLVIHHNTVDNGRMWSLVGY